MDKLTPRQQEILDLIRASLEERGYPPTRAEIAEHFGFRSPNAAQEHLKALVRKGHITMQSDVSRGIQLMDDDFTPGHGHLAVAAEHRLPLIGQVAAGSPVLAVENVENHYAVDPGLFQPAADYLLRVKGMSMRDAGILEDDLLAVHKTTEVRNHQIVVARIDDEVTVKRFMRQGKRVQLLPENPDFQPIEVDLEHQPLVIEGLGVGIIRNR